MRTSTRQAAALVIGLGCSLNASAHDSNSLLMALVVVLALPIPPIVMLAWRHWIWAFIGVLVVWMVGYLLQEHEDRIMDAMGTSFKSGRLTILWLLVPYVIVIFRAIISYLKRRNNAV
jgi:heme/copper-type cytochrome/quinol oxidase subunit 2